MAQAGSTSTSADTSSTSMSADAKKKVYPKSVLKTVFTDVFLLRVLEIDTKDKLKLHPAEQYYFEDNQKFELNKRLVVELYLGLQRLILRSRVPQWRDTPIVKRPLRHNQYKAVLQPHLVDLLIKICGLDRDSIENVPISPNIDSANSNTTQNDDIKIDTNDNNVAHSNVDVDNSDGLSIMEWLYNDAHKMHCFSSQFNSKTQTLFLLEPYRMGIANDNITADKTREALQRFKAVSQRAGLSQNDPFAKFKFSVDIQLLLKQRRTKCPNCQSKVHIYCPHCKLSMPLSDNVVQPPPMKKPRLEGDDGAISDESDRVATNDESAELQIVGALPKLRLPVKVDIIRNRKELVTVCSSVHACVIAPDDVTMYEFPKIPDYRHEKGVFLLYPSAKAQYLDEMDLSTVSKVIVIESKWHGNRGIYGHDSVIDLPHCKMRNRETLYWRYQEHSKEYLATIEAVYYSVLDCYMSQKKQCDGGTPYNGEFDDLLLLFAHDHARIRQELSKNKNKKMPKVWTAAADDSQS